MIDPVKKQAGIEMATKLQDALAEAVGKMGGIVISYVGLLSHAEIMIISEVVVEHLLDSFKQAHKKSKQQQNNTEGSPYNQT